MRREVIYDHGPHRAVHKLDHFPAVGQLAAVIVLVLRLPHLVLLLPNAIWPLVQEVAEV